jgi:hypothetical protein
MVELLGAIGVCVIPILLIIGLPVLVLIVTNYLNFVVPVQIILTIIAGLFLVSTLRSWLQQLSKAFEAFERENE